MDKWFQFRTKACVYKQLLTGSEAMQRRIRIQYGVQAYSLRLNYFPNIVFDILQPNAAVEWLVLLHHISAVRGSNLVPGISYPYWGFK
jgi:hypothetical protein